MDFVVTLDPKSFDAYMNVKLYLETLFGRPVVLVLEDAVKPRLRAAILDEAVRAEGF